MFRGLFDSIYGVLFVFRAQYVGFYYRRIGGFFVKGGTGDNCIGNVRLISYVSKSGFNIERLWQKKVGWALSFAGDVRSIERSPGGPRFEGGASVSNAAIGGQLCLTLKQGAG